MSNKIDVFLMGTAGDYNDPNRSMWREPIKAMLASMGLIAFDPVKANWTPADTAIEADAMNVAPILVVYVSTITSGIASLVEIGFAILRAVLQNKVVILCVEQYATKTPQNDDSRRGRATAITNINLLSAELPDTVIVATNLADLQRQVYEQARQLKIERLRETARFVTRYDDNYGHPQKD